MKTSKLLIVGGLVLAGGYLFLRKKKPKTDTQELFKDNLIPNEPVEDTSVLKTTEKQELITPKEATVYATKTIAEVNSLIVKYPPLTIEQVVDNYNSSYKTNLYIDPNTSIILSPKVELGKLSDAQIVANAITNNKFGGLASLLKGNLEVIKNSDANAYNANNTFKGQQVIYARWKSDFSTVYSDLKNYYSTLTKEEADFIIKYLPKMIIRVFMGDNDPRATANDFYSQEEIIDMVDNNFVKNTDEVLGSALGGFFDNTKMFMGDYSDIRNAITKEKQRELVQIQKMKELAVIENLKN